VSLETADLLDFQRCHAEARDAVHSQLAATSLVASLHDRTTAEVFRLHSAAPDRATYLQRPDLGRTLDEASRALLSRHGTPHSPENLPTLSVVVADGLSALAVERHAIPLLQELLPILQNLTLAPVCVVEQGRVAIADEIGLALGAQLSIILIGERPGLSSPDSLGAYITWRPRPGRTDAERNCISNIRTEGLSYARAAAQLVDYIAQAQHRQLTGIALKEQSHALGEG
jgi:ethanolamine ammonia-lyase small subunit